MACGGGVGRQSGLQQGNESGGHCRSWIVGHDSCSRMQEELRWVLWFGSGMSPKGLSIKGWSKLDSRGRW
jgi:hypothetical protein